MEENKKTNSSIVPVSSSNLIRLGNSLEITNKLLIERADYYFELGVKLKKQNKMAMFLIKYDYLKFA
jgi:hypothetical protein